MALQVSLGFIASSVLLGWTTSFGKFSCQRQAHQRGVWRRPTLSGPPQWAVPVASDAHCRPCRCSRAVGLETSSQNFPNTDASAFRVVHYTNMKIRDDESVRDLRRLLNQKRILMDLLGEEGPRFPHRLSKRVGPYTVWTRSQHRWRKLCDYLVWTTPTACERLPSLCVRQESWKKEMRRRAAIKKHQQSMRHFPAIEDWHEAIFEPCLSFATLTRHP